jgi:glycosyltransferase involved in cell wall biosynthesis
VNSSLKIALISKYSSDAGGASRVAERLLRAVKKHSSHQIELIGLWPSPREVNSPLSKRALSFIQRASLRFFPGEIMPVELLYILPHIFDADIVHIHDSYQAISASTARFISLLKPTFFTLHDESPFTGGCLYQSSNPQFHDTPAKLSLNTESITLSLKRWIYKGAKIKFIAPSRWMAQRALKSGVINEVLHLDNFVDQDIFSAERRVRAREKFPLNHKPTILLSANDYKDQRKGGLIAVEILKELIRSKSDFTLLLVGEDNQGIFSEFNPIRVGKITGDHALADVYSAADLLLFPSLIENQPLTIIEALSVGTPVAAFAVGGVPELIEEDITGVMANEINVRALLEKLSLLLQNSEKLASLREASLKSSHPRFSADLAVKKHLELWEGGRAISYS